MKKSFAPWIPALLVGVIGFSILGHFVWKKYRDLTADTVAIPTGDFSTALAGEYQLHYTSGSQVSITPEPGYHEGTPVIPAKVIACATDGRYILAQRHGLKPRRSGSQEDVPLEEDDKVEDYWILDTKAQKLAGPLTEQTFTQLRADLGIHPGLELREAQDYHPAKQRRGASWNLVRMENGTPKPSLISAAVRP